MIASPFTPMSMPMNGEIALKERPTSTPAAPARAEATAKVTRMTRSVEMPSSRAVSVFSALARIAMPIRVRVTHRCRASMSTKSVPGFLRFDPAA